MVGLSGIDHLSLLLTLHASNWWILLYIHHVICGIRMAEILYSISVLQLSPTSCFLMPVVSITVVKIELKGSQ